jgi:dienelactone hydrolase
MRRFGGVLRLGVWLVASVAVADLLHGAARAQDADARDQEAWETIAPFFRPPAELADDLGDYRSPLVFDDGRPVETPDQWPERREEILRFWHKALGPWPPLIENPGIEVLKTEAREGFTQKKVRLQAAPQLEIEGYLLLPPGDGRRPAVLVVYYDPETGAGLNPESKLRDFGYQLTRRGFVTLSIGWPRDYTTRQSPSLQPLSCLAYVAANCYRVLAALPEVDPERVGIVGHSFGGKWAMFASCLYDKFACAVYSDPGIVFDEKRPNVNYWEPWYLGYEAGRTRKPGVPSEDNPRTGPYKMLVETGHDLHELHALMAPRPLLVSGGSEDRAERWTALNHAVAVNKLLGYENRVAMTNRQGHSPTEESNEQLYRFFEHFLMHASTPPLR